MREAGEGVGAAAGARAPSHMGEEAAVMREEAARVRVPAPRGAGQ